MRYLTVLVLVLGLPLPAAAQQPHQQRQQTSTLPSIGLPLPTIGLPLPSLGLPPQSSTPALQPVPGLPRNEPVHPDFRPGGRGHHRPSPIYVYSPYPFVMTNPTQVSGYVTPPPPTPPASPPPAQATTGRLRIESELPADIVQVFVDGAFAGTLDELDHEVELKPGAWRIELRSQGYRSITFMTQIVANKTITYRAALERDPSAAPPAQAKPEAPPQIATGSRTIYFIPGCYLGNVPPVEIKLPAGCDLSKLRTTTP
jgi:hypothetical protein